MYIKEFEIRWSDVDANRHLRNSAYIDFMSHTRMSYFGSKGFGQQHLAEMNLGPVALYERMYYFKEAFPGKPLRVSLQLKGLSEKGTFFEFRHNFYDHKGRNLGRCEMLGAWIDLKERKLVPLPEEFYSFLDGIDKTDDFKILTKEDTRKNGQFPEDLEE
ncbi:MAG: thioesterase [Flavobacteriaceae bacterium]|mgnify:CR=1 FL=1|nr:thioesterase [Flavobacteriaceae bacterium]|tara:strand:+ start:2010 stop:2489 length:480 start_codon:yes stop_codon:yes gene_type:complete